MSSDGRLLGLGKVSASSVRLGFLSGIRDLNEKIVHLTVLFILKATNLMENALKSLSWSRARAHRTASYRLSTPSR